MKRNFCFLYTFIAFQLFLQCISSALTVKEIRDLKLNRPYHIRWHIQGDTVVLNWKYRKSSPPPLGYYVQVQESLTKKPLGSLNFVRVDDNSHSVEITGLKPHSLYHMKVVAFSESEHKASRTIRVKTTRLAFLQAFDLKASSITDTSAIFTWKHTPKNNVHDIQFKLSCNGVTNYQQDGNTVEEDIYFEHLSSSSSSGQETYSTSTLLPNTLYTCHMLSVADNSNSEPHSEIQFVTLPGKPPRPSRPKVIVTNSQAKPKTSFHVELFTVSNRFGEISHYTVFAVPVSRGTNAARSMPYTPIVPYHQLLSKAISAHLASSVSDKVPFIVGKYEAGLLPDKLVFDGSFRTKDFKADTHYAFVLAAFTKTKNSTGMRYSLSDPSDPPVYIGPDMQKEWIKQRKPAAKQFASTVLYTVIMAVVILTVIVLILVGLAYMKQQEYGTILSLSDEESEIEIFSKPSRKSRRNGGRNKRKNKKLLLLEPPLYKKIKGTTDDVTKWLTGKTTKKYGKNSSHAYHSIDTTEQYAVANDKQQKRVDEVKRFSQFDEPEGRLNLYLVVTPPDSPRSSSRPTSPLLQARRGNPTSPSPWLFNNQSTPPMIEPVNKNPVSLMFPQSISPYHVIHEPHCMEYMASPVATNINIEEDIIASSFTLPRARPYSLPRSVINSQHYYKTHPPGSPMPKMPAPEAPKPAARKMATQKAQKPGSNQEPQTGVCELSKREVVPTKDLKQSYNPQTHVRRIKPAKHNTNEVPQQTNVDGMLMPDEESEKQCSVSSMDDELFVDALSQ